MALRRRGFLVNHKLVLKLMKEEQLTCQVRLKKYRSYRGEVGKIAPNRLERRFTAEAPRQKWVTDVTEFSLFGRKLYLSPILDLYNSEIVTYTLSDRPTLEPVLDMLRLALTGLPADTGLIFHSDQGWQYQHSQFRKLLQDHGIRQSMSRRGNCLDNSVMENFFGLLKSELLYLSTFDSLEHFRHELIAYLDYYNNRRIKIKLNGLSPVEYRTQTVKAS